MKPKGNATIMAIIKLSAPGRYAELVNAFPLRPIRSDAELVRAIEIVDSLIDRDEIDQDEQDYLDVLSDQVEKYEKVNHPLPSVSEADMLRHLIESKGVSQVQLAADAGIAESTISAILTGKRGLNKDHVARMARYFHVSPGVFFGTT